MIMTTAVSGAVVRGLSPRTDRDDPFVDDLRFSVKQSIDATRSGEIRGSFVRTDVLENQGGKGKEIVGMRFVLVYWYKAVKKQRAVQVPWANERTP